MLFYLAFLLNLNTPAAPLLYNCLNVQIGRQQNYAARSKLVLYAFFHFSVVLYFGYPFAAYENCYFLLLTLCQPAILAYPRLCPITVPIAH